MAWKQTRSFDPAKMGTKKGWCLQNTRLGFGIATGHYSSAKADMEAQRKNGTLHDISTLPSNVSVPIYIDTASQYEHIGAQHNGYFYSDGQKVSSYSIYGKAFGWGEFCDGQRVVEWVADPTPTPTDPFLPARGYWTLGDRDSRISRLATFMRKTFKAYTPSSALGPILGPNLQKSIKQFQKRCGIEADGNVGPITLAMLKKYGFQG